MGKNKEKVKTLEIVDLIETQYKPFHPLHNNHMSIYARFMNEPMDESECELTPLDDNGAISNNECKTKIYCFEIYTLHQIDTYYDYFINQKQQDLAPFAYIFTVKCEIGSPDDKFISELKERYTNGEFFRGFLHTISSPANEELYGLNGSLEAFYNANHEYSEEFIPSLCEAKLCLNIRASYQVTDDESIKRMKEVIDSFSNDNNSSNPDEDSDDDATAPEDIGKIRVEIINVGGANAIHVKYPNGKSLLFDCGCDRYDPAFYSKGIKYIRSLHPTGIIISHWHIDHYCLLTELNTDKLEFIAYRDLKNIHLSYNTWLNSLKGVAQYKLFSSGPSGKYQSLFYTNGYSKTVVFAGGNIKPALADQTKSSLGKIPYSMDLNDSALILCVGLNSKRIILPSDVSYHSWPDDALLDLTTCYDLMVPHHGGNVYITNDTTTNSSPFKKVFVSSYFNAFTDIGDTRHSTYIQTRMGISGSSIDCKKTAQLNTITGKQKPYYYVLI